MNEFNSMENLNLQELKEKLLDTSYNLYWHIMQKFLYDNTECIDETGVVINIDLFSLHIECICKNFNKLCETCAELEDSINTASLNENTYFNNLKISKLRKQLKILELDRDKYFKYLINVNKVLNILTVNTIGD